MTGWCRILFFSSSLYRKSLRVCVCVPFYCRTSHTPLHYPHRVQVEKREFARRVKIQRSERGESKTMGLPDGDEVGRFTHVQR
jgi:hypothetical protein